MKKNFFNFIQPFIDMVDNGSFFKRPLSWVYIGFAVLNLLMPLYVLYLGIDGGMFGVGFKTALSFVLMWLFLLFGAWVGFQIWWNRTEKLLHITRVEDDFVTPVFTHFIQTFGEWIGSFVAIVGFGVALVGTIFGVMSLLPGFFDAGVSVVNIVLFPVAGYVIIIAFRFVAEQARALVQIANNTKK